MSKDLDKVAGSKAIAVPDWMKSEKGKGGLESIKPSDLQMSILKVMQSNSPEVISGKAKIGDIFNPATGESYGNEIEFIPLIDIKQAIKWKTAAEGGGMACISNDTVNGSTYGSCASCAFNYDKWRDQGLSEEERKKICSAYINYAVIVNNELIPVTLAFSRTSFKVGAKLAQLYMKLCSENGQYPMYCFKFKLRTVVQKNAKGTWMNLEIIPNGMTDQAVGTRAKDTYNMLKATKYHIKHEE